MLQRAKGFFAHLSTRADRYLPGLFRRGTPPRMFVEIIVLAVSILSLFFVTLHTNFSITSQQQFAHLAQSFLQGVAYFLNPFFDAPGETLIDTVFIHGRYYWPLSPLPAILLMPFVHVASVFHGFFLQGYLQFFLTLGIFMLCVSIARHWSYSHRDALWLAFAFVFASTYHLVAFVSHSWYFVQAIAVFFTLFAIQEWLGRRRWWMIGIACALVFASRVTAGVGVLFFVGDILFQSSRLPSRKQYVSLAQLLVPIFLAGVLLLGYNAVRFGTIFENGYRLANASTATAEDRYELLHYGLFRIENIPTNLYYYFVRSLDPVTLPIATSSRRTYHLTAPYVTVGDPGVSFFVTAPIFLYLFSRKTRQSLREERSVRLAAMTVVPILLLLLLYYWPGWTQVGPRYMLDLLPYLFLVLLASFHNYRLPAFARILIICSAALNLFLTIHF
ncbi:MAG: hypothetical protein Q7S96_04895 [bacterium]|nr:hypothetical protein [bacterium]